MQLSAGDRLGPYEIVAQIGAGGMGVVYRAHDPRVGRDVAIKVSGEHFTDRFEREARAVAALTHANVCTLHDVGPNFIVMELVEGEPPKGPLPLQAAVHYARQIADALDAAHEKGIVHRDLKPDNIRIKPDGTVKVLDFGLAKMDAGAAGAVNLANSPTTLGVTQAGMILGTAAYMAPEQARGKPVDKRADIWAFGVVFYEMLTGRRAFEGDDVSSILAAVIQSEPRWEGVPASVRRLLASCLEKDPRKRLRDIGDVWKLLDDDQKPAAARSPSRSAGWIAAAALAVALAAAVTLWGPWRSPAPAAPLPLVTLDVDLGADVSLLPLVAPTFSSLIISPGGNRLVFVGSLSGGAPRLYTRRLDESRITELAGTTGAGNPFFTPDGQWVAFFNRGKLAKVPVEGGAVVPLADLEVMTGGSVADDGSLVVGSGPKGSGLVRIPPGGGTPSPLVPLANGEMFHTSPQFLPGRNAVLFAAVSTPPSMDSNIDIVFLDDGRRKTVQRGATSPRYLPSGHLLYNNRSGMFAVPIDTGTWEPRSPAIPILADVASDEIARGAQYDVADNGTLVYRKASDADSARLVRWLDRSGRQEPLLPKPGAYLGMPRLSHDGGRVALTVQDGANQDIWVYDIQRDGLTPLTVGGGAFGTPVWTRKGRIIFSSMGAGIFWTRADGEGQPQALLSTGTFEWPTSLTTGGERLAFARVDRGPQIWTVELKEDESVLKAGQQLPFRTTTSSEEGAAFSPDGRWVAYEADDSGKPEVYVSPFPASAGTEGRVQISNGGGERPLWAPDGRELLYQAGGRIMTVPYSTSGGSFAAEKPRPWSSADVTGVTGFDIAPDGRLAIIVLAASRKAPQSEHTIGFMQNFFDELRRRAPVAR